MGATNFAPFSPHKQIKKIPPEWTKYPLGRARNLSKKAVYEFAENISKAFRTGQSKFDIATVITAFGGEISYSDEANDAFSSGSVFVHGPGAFNVILPNHTSGTRDTFTLAHELGHYVLHSKLGESVMRANRLGSGPIEWEANWFAASFLMPQYLITEHRLDTAFAIAAFFSVSVDAASVRLKNC